MAQELAETGKKERIPKRVQQAVAMLVSGRAITQKAAAEAVGLHESTLCRALRKSTTRVFYERAARDSIAAGVMRASARLINLVDAESEHVSFDASKHVLGIAGIKPANEQQLSVNVDIKAGYVIDISGSRDVTSNVTTSALRTIEQTQPSKISNLAPGDAYER